MCSIDLGCQEYDIDYEVIPEDCQENRNVGAKAKINSMYLWAMLTFYPRSIVELRENLDEFVKTCFHEIAHIITQPLYLESSRAASHATGDYLETIWEQTTERIARVGYKVYQLRGGLKQFAQ